MIASRPVHACFCRNLYATPGADDAPDACEQSREIPEFLRAAALPIYTQRFANSTPRNLQARSNLSVTDAPDDGTLYKDEDEQWKNYSISHDLLKDFADFCLQSKGFQVF